MITGEGWDNPNRFRRVLVLPFNDGSGRGKEIAVLVASELGRSGYDPVEPTQAQAVLEELRIGEGEELSLFTLADIRARTRAEAVVTGSVEQSWKGVSVMAIETAEGDVVASTFARAPYREPFKRAQDVARAAAQALASSARGARRAQD